MAIIIPHSFINGTIAEASEVNANFTAIKLFVDGLADGSEIESSAIITSKINNSAVTTEKISNLAATTEKINNSAVTTEKINNGNVTYVKLDSADVLANLAFNDQILIGGQVFG
jgi:hypothetical protein